MYEPKHAREIMATRLVTISPETDVFDAVDLLIKHGISGMPVVDAGGSFLGVFSEKCAMHLLTLAARRTQVQPSALDLRARDFMVTRLVTLTPDLDVFHAIGYLLKNRISGASVIDDRRKFLGVFSEKTSMSVLIGGAYEQLPTNDVSAFMNRDVKRTISQETDLLTVIKIFVDTPYRRLPVLRDGELVGQISRRDALQAARRNTQLIQDRDKTEAFLREQTQSIRPIAQEESLLEWFLDRDARTITEEIDLLSIAQIFLNGPYRRLPVLTEGKLVGQVSRRDLLHATFELTHDPKEPKSSFLYFSSLKPRDEAPI